MATSHADRLASFRASALRASDQRTRRRACPQSAAVQQGSPHDELMQDAIDEIMTSRPPADCPTVEMTAPPASKLTRMFARCGRPRLEALATKLAGSDGQRGALRDAITRFLAQTGGTETEAPYRGFVRMSIADDWQLVAQGSTMQEVQERLEALSLPGRHRVLPRGINAAAPHLIPHYQPTR